MDIDRRCEEKRLEIEVADDGRIRAVKQYCKARDIKRWKHVRARAGLDG